MTYELPIQGTRIIPGFNGVGVINLEDYFNVNVLPPTITSGTFSHVGVLDLDTVDEDDPRWLNVGIREEGNTEERIEAFTNKYEIDGWKTSYVPPLISTDGDPRDGRGRIIAAKRRGEKYIPAYYYVIEQDSERSRVTDGLKLNLGHDPHFRATRESVIVGCLYLIKNDELKLSEIAILDYLQRDLQIGKLFSKDNITKIVNGVLHRGVAGGDPLVLVKDRKKWLSFCEKAGKKVDNQKVFLMAVDSETYPFRAWCQHCLPSVASNEAPIDFILYSNRHIPSEARANMKAFEDALEIYLEASYLMIGKDYGLSMNPRQKPYNIVGCIPQIIGGHDGAAKAYRFVPIKDY